MDLLAKFAPHSRLPYLDFYGIYKEVYFLDLGTLKKLYTKRKIYETSAVFAIEKYKPAVS